MNIWEKSGYHQSANNKMAEGIKKECEAWTVPSKTNVQRGRGQDPQANRNFSEFTTTLTFM